MKLTFFIILFALFGNKAFSQDSDSMQYVVPSTAPASLDLYQAPEGFVQGTGFNGYIHALTQTTVVLTMIENGNYINIQKAMTEQYFAENKLVKLKEFEVSCASGLKGIGYVASFTLEGRKMIRHIVFIGNMNKTLWLSVTFPEENNALVEPEMMKSYNTVSFTK